MTKICKSNNSNKLSSSKSALEQQQRRHRRRFFCWRNFFPLFIYQHFVSFSFLSVFRGRLKAKRYFHDDDEHDDEKEKNDEIFPLTRHFFAHQGKFLLFFWIFLEWFRLLFEWRLTRIFFTWTFIALRDIKPFFKEKFIHLCNW